MNFFSALPEWARTIGEYGGILYIGDKIGRVLEPLIYKYIKRPLLARRAIRMYEREVSDGHSRSVLNVLAMEVHYLTGKFPEGFKLPPPEPMIQEITKEEFEEATASKRS